MTINERLNLQKSKKIPVRLQIASNSENDIIDNYIQNKLKIREILKNQDVEIQIFNKIQEAIEKALK